jgi:hypothetical protein
MFPKQQVRHLNGMMRHLTLILSRLITCAMVVTGLHGQTSPPADAEVEQFLKTARILSSALIGQGVTKASRATLSLKGRVHDAQVQSINIKLNDLYAPDGKPVPWRDDYKHNIAAYKLDRLLMLNMVPPTVERLVGKQRAGVTWWVDDVAMMEMDRERKKIDPPDPESWSKQLSIATTFDQLIYNVDRNTGNLLITKDWKLVLIDHTRAFAPNPRLMDRPNFQRCSRQLLEALRSLNNEKLIAALSPYLTPAQVSGMLVRRDMIVKHFDKLIEEKGETAVLFP